MTATTGVLRRTNVNGPDLKESGPFLKIDREVSPSEQDQVPLVSLNGR
jgi:hypothetical protein